MLSLHWLDRHQCPILIKRLSIKLYLKVSIIMCHTTVLQWYKKVRSTSSVKRQREGERKGISDWYLIIVEVQEAYPGLRLTNQLDVKQLVEQFLDVGPKCSSFRFLFVL